MQIKIFVVHISVAKDRTDFFEVALSMKRHDLNLAKELNDAFEQATHLKNERRYSNSSRPPSVAESEDSSATDDQRPAQNVDPGMSVLQGSVLGMHPDGIVVHVFIAIALYVARYKK